MIQMKTLPQPDAARRTSPPTTDPIVNGSCPYLDRNDPRCSSRFALDRLDQMLDVCLGPGAAGCFMHHRIRHEDDFATASDHLTSLTHDGQPLRLRPTGS